MNESTKCAARRRTVALAALAGIAWSGAACAQGAAASAAATPCEKLSGLEIPQTSIRAQLVAASTVIPRPKRQVGSDEADSNAANRPGTRVSQPFCRVEATTTPAPGAEIWTEVWLPLAGAWNGKFLGAGNGGAAGGLNHGALSNGLARGFAVAHTDVGTKSQGGGYANPSSFRFGLGKPELQQNYVHRGIHSMTVVGKEVTRAFYGRAPAKSLFVGCSTGGYEALGEAHRYPDDYDGIISGDMPAEFANVALFQGWVSASSNRVPGASIPPEKLPAISRTVMERCDGLDGIHDGVIDDPRRCRFDPQIMQCAGEDAADCLTAPQVEAARKIYGGLRNPRTGALIYPGFPPGAELSEGAKTRVADDNVGSLINANTPAVAVWALGESWSAKNWLSFDFDKDAEKLQRELEWLEHGDAPQKMQAFRNQGGKLLLFTGWADPNLSPDHIASFYDSLEASVGGPQKNDFVRFFLAPGMYHCRGGPGPNDFGQSTRANQSGATPENDLVLALDRWASEGVAPERVVATKFLDDDPKKGIVRTRPLCAYPKVARWNGRGSSDDAKNFVCASPD